MVTSFTRSGLLMISSAFLALVCGLQIALSGADLPPAPRSETWDYLPTITAIATHFSGSAGMVVPLGDSITYANQAGRWARSGLGRTPEELALASWMHAGQN